MEIFDNAVEDDDETIEVHLLASGGYAVALPASVTITIRDEEAGSRMGSTVPMLTASSDAASVTVSSATISYTVSTTDDTTDEPNGSVTATLAAGGGYPMSATQGAATEAVSH